MSDPLDKATSKAPATLGEGCLSRYDPDDLSPEDGTEFPAPPSCGSNSRSRRTNLRSLPELQQLLEQWPPQHQ